MGSSPYTLRYNEAVVKISFIIVDKVKEKQQLLCAGLLLRHLYA